MKISYLIESRKERFGYVKEGHCLVPCYLVRGDGEGKRVDVTHTHFYIELAPPHPSLIVMFSTVREDNTVSATLKISFCFGVIVAVNACDISLCKYC